MPTKHAGAQKHFGDVAPKLAEISGDVLYNDVWERPGLSKRDRCMITVASLITGYRTHQLPFHIKKALDHGVTRQELAEMITHLAFYAGWPQASTTVGIARQVFEEEGL